MLEWFIANMYYVIFSGWGLGMLGYIVLNKYSRYNNKHYMDIKDFKRQFKKHRDEVNGVEKHNSSGWGK